MWDFPHIIQYRMQRNSLPLFNMLRAIYKAALDREPAFHEVCTFAVCQNILVNLNLFN